MTLQDFINDGWEILYGASVRTTIGMERKLPDGTTENLSFDICLFSLPTEHEIPEQYVSQFQFSVYKNGFLNGRRADRLNAVSPESINQIFQQIKAVTYDND